MYVAGCSVFEVLPETFYEVKQSKAQEIQNWVNFLKRHSLDKFISNPKLKNVGLSEEKDEFPEKFQWYFLGRISDWFWLIDLPFLQIESMRGTFLQS